MLDLREIARMEEARQARGLADVADESLAIAGGTIARGTPGTWFNSGVGMGLHGPVTPGDLDEMYEYHASRGIEPRLEVCPYAHATLLEGLGARGYIVRNFETVFWRALDPGEDVRTPVEPPPGLVVGAVDPGDEALTRAYARVAVSGFLPEGHAMASEFMASALRCLRHPRTIGVGAWLDGELVGAGAMDVSPPAAGFFGLSVLAHARRKGVQQAMLAWRIREAARRGSVVACIGSLPGAGTERNVRRMGFAPAYTKVTLVRPGAGLAPVAG